MKEQDKTSGKKLSEMKISHLSDKTFKVMVIKTLIKYGRKLNKYSDNFINRDRKYKKVPNRSQS